MARSRRRPRDADGKTWQQTKSENTRQVILDAAIDCLYELGYSNTTASKIARRARVSRGAMLHHFASRDQLIRATVAHLARKRLDLFEEDERRIQRAEVSLIDEGIDGYWRQLNTKLFVVFHELQVAARTDAELREILIPAIREFDAKWANLTSAIFPDLAQSEQFMNANLLTLFLLEGLAVNRFTRATSQTSERILKLLKYQLKELFADVLADPTPQSDDVEGGRHKAVRGA